VGKSDDIVDDLLDRYPRSLTGRTQLTRVHLHLEAYERDQWALWVRPITRAAAAQATAELRLHRTGRADLNGFGGLPHGQDTMHELHIDAVARAAE